jgi:ABC-2 type transport system ATP-binding protein
MPVDRPRRALLEEPDDVESYVARRSLGLTPAHNGDPIAVHPARAAGAFEPAATAQEVAVSDHPRLPDPAPWPRRAFLAEAAQQPEPAAPVAPFPFEMSPQPRRSAPSPSVEPDRATTSALRHTRPSRRTVHHEVPPIIVDRLIKSYHGTLAVHNLSFVVQPGRVTGFLGPNGAGKTTTLRILVGLTTPTTGTATFGDLAYADLPHPLQTVGCVLDASFHPARSGRNHLRMLAPTAGASDRRVDHLLAELGLGEVARQPVAEYSLGMRQRLALAAALLGKPDYLILDEPANGLDPDGIRWLRTFLRDFAASGRTVLISSHLLNEIEATADDIVVINRGRLVAQMPMSGLNLGAGRDLEQEFFSMLEGSR